MKQLDTSFSHKYKFKNGLFVRLTRLIYLGNEWGHVQVEMGPKNTPEQEFERLYYSSEFQKALTHYQEQYQQFLREYYPERFRVEQS
jgi:hypothetical protein